MAKKATKKKTPAKKAPAKKPAAKAPPKKAAAKKSGKKAASSSITVDDPHQSLREELAAARQELARLAREENVVKRDLEASLSSAKSANERLQAELDAVRIDLKTALADLEIARAEQQRNEGKAHSAARDLVQAHEAARLAEHAAAEMREQFYETRNACDTLRDENARLRAELAAVQAPASAQGSGGTTPSATG